MVAHVVRRGTDRKQRRCPDQHCLLLRDDVDFTEHRFPDVDTVRGNLRSALRIGNSQLHAPSPWACRIESSDWPNHARRIIIDFPGIRHSRLNRIRSRNDLLAHGRGFCAGDTNHRKGAGLYRRDHSRLTSLAGYRLDDVTNRVLAWMFVPMSDRRAHTGLGPTQILAMSITPVDGSKLDVQAEAVIGQPKGLIHSCP